MDKYKVTHLIMKHFFRKEHFQEIVVKIKHPTELNHL